MMTMNEVQDGFLENLKQSAKTAAERHKEFRETHRGDSHHEANWAEAKLIAEIYHELRSHGVDSNNLTVEQPHPKRKRRYFDIGYIPKSGKSWYVQVISYDSSEGPLYAKHLNDMDALSGLPADDEKVVVIVRYGGETERLGPRVEGKLARAGKQHTTVIKIPDG